jgi:hypothetical protein
MKKLSDFIIPPTPLERVIFTRAPAWFHKPHYQALIAFAVVMVLAYLVIGAER